MWIDVLFVTQRCGHEESYPAIASTDLHATCYSWMFCFYRWLWLEPLVVVRCRFYGMTLTSFDPVTLTSLTQVTLMTPLSLMISLTYMTALTLMT